MRGISIVSVVGVLFFCLFAVESFANRREHHDEGRRRSGIHKVQKAREILLNALDRCSIKQRDIEEGSRLERSSRRLGCFEKKVNRALNRLEDFLAQRDDGYEHPRDDGHEHPIERPKKCSDWKDDKGRFACNKEKWHRVVCSGVGYYGKYGEQGGCNYYGCWYAGGGCNYYGCWYAGGSCNYYGCIRTASKTTQACVEL